VVFQVCSFMSPMILAFSRVLKTEFVILNLLMNKNHGFYDIAFLVKKYFDKVFVGITSISPSRDFTRPIGMPRGLKGLLHMLNAIVFPMKEELM
jgi:hypothetical protein